MKTIDWNRVCQEMRDVTGWEQNPVDLGMTRYIAYAVLGVN
jgi:hypothetical protein